MALISGQAQETGREGVSGVLARSNTAAIPDLDPRLNFGHKLYSASISTPQLWPGLPCCGS